MNTDTPECNALWEKGWNHTRLWELSQKLERERDEAREQLDGIEAKMLLELGGHPNSKLWGDAGLIAATMRCVDALNEVTDQRDRLATALVNCREDSFELLAERDWWQNEPRGGYQKMYQTTRDNIDRADAALQPIKI